MTEPSRYFTYFIGPIAIALALVLALVHRQLPSPLIALTQGQILVAAGAWFFAPATLAGLAILVGKVRLSDAWEHSPLPPQAMPFFAALLVPLALAFFSYVNLPASDRPATWLVESATIGLMIGLGLAMSALFWQGCVQRYWLKSVPSRVRMPIFGILSALPSLAFLAHPMVPEELHFDAISFELLTSHMVFAALYDTGLSIRLIALNAIVMGVGIGIIKHAYLI